MKELLEEIRHRIEPIIEAKNAYLVDIHLRGEGGNKVLEIFVDTDSGINVDTCAEISRDISAMSDRENLIQGRYRLEVSSPGVSRPLKLHRQYKQNVGRELKVTYRSAQEKKTVIGELVEVQDSGVVLKLNDEQLMEIAFDSIIESLVQIRF